MPKRKVFLYIPVAVITGYMIYTWYGILFINHWATWRHYTGLALFVALLYFLFKDFKKGVLATGIYLIAGTLNLLSITPDVLELWGFRIGPMEVALPVFQPRLFLIFLLYFFLCFDTLVNMRLDYKEKKESKKKQ